MDGSLFHPVDNFFAMGELRAAARVEVENSPLIQRCALGKKDAAIAMHKGFWPFVRDFEIAIDERKMTREPLYNKFGKNESRQTILNLTRAVAEMKKEEGSHAAHWRKDAVELGVSDIEAPCLAGVRQLIDSANTPDLPRFFAVQAGTEFIAEELSSYLTASRLFTNLFGRKRWVWGEVHLIPHDHGPSHLQIDLDLARAYSEQSEEETRLLIEVMVLDTIRLFGAAAREVDQEVSLSVAA